MANTQESGASAPSDSQSAEYTEIVVKRDGHRPLSFAGQVLGKVTMSGGFVGWSLEAAIYKTRGGKFVSMLSKANHLASLVEGIQDPEKSGSSEFHKAVVFDTFDAAVGWYRPGRVTDALRKQLGLDEPERID